jgi:hypothetical protein
VVPRTDEECARRLGRILTRVPPQLEGDGRSAFPLLEALFRFDVLHGSDLGRQLVFLGAITHRTADERRTAEYLLRNRGLVALGQRSARSLLLAARCAAEMDVRRIAQVEVPTPLRALAARATSSALSPQPSVGETVLDYLQSVIGREVSVPAGEAIRNAVAAGLELAERHRMNGGRKPAVLGMRADARPDARLLTRLRIEFASETVAVAVARTLVGPDHSPIETALLWWSAQTNSVAADLPSAIRDRWMRDLLVIEAALAAT